MENGVTFDGAVGVSAGAAFGCNIKSHQIGRVLRYNTRFCADKRYCGMSSLLKTGNIYSTEFCYGEVPLKYDPFDFETYKKDPMEFYVVSTDVETGRPVYHKYTGEEDSGFDWIRASASMPLVSQIVEIDGQKLLDGGISDSIPVEFFESLGYDRNVAVLTQPKTYQKSKNKMGVMPVGKLLANMAIPMVISMLVQAMYNVVDSYFVAKISTDALTAISLAYPIQMLMIAVAIGTSVGMNSYMSRKLGEGNTEAASKGASNGLCLLLLSAIVFAIFGLVITPFFRLFTDDPQLIEMGVDYLEICMVFGLGVFIQIGCERILQSMGKTGLSMVTQLVGRRGICYGNRTMGRNADGIGTCVF